MRSAQNPRIIALLLAVLLLSACGQVVAKPHATATTPAPTPMPTLPPTPTVAVIHSSGQPTWGKTAYWSHANLPAGFGMQFHVSDLQVAPSDGETAYSCAAPVTANIPQVIVTHDAGAHWQATAPVAPAFDECDQLVIDQLNPQIVIAESCCSVGPAAISRDGGASWHALPSADQHMISQIATIGTKTWGLVSVPITNGVNYILGESDDGMQTWREIDGTLAGKNLRGFWINPGNGALLLQEYDTGLWTSTDDGAHWQQMGNPASNIVDYMVQQPIANLPWRLCAEYYASQNSSTGSLICTADGGYAWYDPPAEPFWQMAGISSDGALLVYDSGYMVYRLPVGATRWQKLGAAPHTGCCIHYAPTSQSGMLWMFAAESDGAGAPPDPRAIFSARYPY